MKVTTEAILADGYGAPGCYCRSPGHAPWACPADDDSWPVDEPEPTEGTHAAPPSLTFKVADVPLSA
jgi:hypothetical protein